jgi:hypothetical protein
MEGMTSDKRNKRIALDRLADALVEDILRTSDEEILAEFQESEGDPDRHAIEMRNLFERSIIAANKHRLAAAKVGAAASRTIGTKVTNIGDARARLRAVLDAPNLPPQFTLAARKENELSDFDIASMLDDLRELGIIPPDDNQGENS